MRIEDYLSLIEVERINVLFTPIENEKIRGLETSFFKFKIPLEATHGRTTVKALSVVPLVGQAEKLVQGLLWEAMFGKKFKVVHWMILFQIFLKTIKKTRESEVLLRVLYVTTASAGINKWNSNMKPMKTLLSKCFTEDEVKIIIDETLKFLPVKLPKKSSNLETLFRIDYNAAITQQVPKELRRIGVGYKDKGSLRKETGSVEPLSFNFEEKEQVFDTLFRRVKDSFKNVHDN